MFGVNFFYLNERQEPQGPFTRDELLNLLNSGSITRSTLAAAAGDETWKPLADVLKLPELPAGAAAPPPLPEGDLGQCPFCRQPLRGATTPADCPHCHQHLHPGTDALWANFVYAFKRFLSFRGRATRTEFWSFYLFSYIISYIPGMILCCACMPLGTMAGLMSEESDGSLAAGLLLIGLVLLYLLVSLLMVLPYWATTVRRLHDRNHSGWLLLWPPAVLVLLTGGTALTTALCYGDSAAASQASVPFITGILLSVSAYIGTCIYIFIQLVLPGQPGPNKYGPAKLIPFRR